MNIEQFLSHDELLGPDFGADSWSNWKLILKATFGLPLSESEQVTFREIADRNPPTRRVRELWLAVGRRGGKDSIASAIVTYLGAYGNFQPQLRRGEQATIACLACTREQAAIVFNYLRANFEQIPALKELLVSAKDGVITLNNNAQIVIATNSFTHIRGKTVVAAIFDEVAFWHDDDSANPDTAVYNAIMPAMITMRDAGALLIGISTVHRRSGLLHTKITEHIGRDDPDVLSILAPSVTFNPKLLAPDAQQEIERQLAIDPEQAAAEWLSQWRDDLSDMFSAELIDAAMDKDRTVNYPVGHIKYLGTADQSSGRGDSFVLSIGHTEGEMIIIDFIKEWRSPFDVDTVMDEVCWIAKEYRLTEIHHDAFGADFVRVGFRQRGLTSKDIAVKDKGKERKLNRSEIYLTAAAPLGAHRVRVPLAPRFKFQMCALERRPSSSGHDVIDHPKGGHDDVANAVCAAIALLATTIHFSVSGPKLAEVKEAILNPMQAYQRRAYEAELALGLNATAQERWRAATSAEVTFGTGEPKITARLDCTKALAWARTMRRR